MISQYSLSCPFRLCRIIRGFEDKGGIKEFLFSLPRFAICKVCISLNTNVPDCCMDTMTACSSIYMVLVAVIIASSFYRFTE